MPLALGEHARALDDVLELADVAVPPRRAAGSVRRAGVRPASGLPHPLRAVAHERRRQVRDVLAAIAQRRQPQLDDVQAVEEIAAEAARRDLRAQVAVGRGDDRRRPPASAAAIRRAAPRRSRARAAAWPAPTAAARRPRRGTACRRAAASNTPGFDSTAPVNAPRTWPNSSLSNSVSTTAEQLIVTNGLLRRGPTWWKARAASSLPVPVSPRDEHDLRVRRQALDEAEDLLHRRAAPEHAAELELLARPGSRARATCARRSSSSRMSSEQLPQPIEVERLGEVLARAELDRLDRAVDGGVRRSSGSLRSRAPSRGSGAAGRGR